MKIKLSKLICFLVTILCITCLMACGNNPLDEQNKNDTQTKQSQTDSSEYDTNTKPFEPNDNQKNDLIVKITVSADETGIYSTIISLSDKAADKAVIEMVYYGVKGSPQENAIVNTFRIEYCKDDAGKFEIYTFFDGEIYQHLSNKDNVKVTNTFSASFNA